MFETRDAQGSSAPLPSGNQARAAAGGRGEAATKAAPAAGAAGPAVPLAGVRSGTRVKLVSVAAGCQMRARLAGLGLLPGMKVTVVRNTGGGPLVVLVHNTRLALGRGMSHHILVAPDGS